MPMSERPPENVDVLVVGAGPVGLLAGLHAARCGLEVAVVDHVWRGYGQGRATLLHAAVLDLLDHDGIAADLCARGRKIDQLAIRTDGVDRATLELPRPLLAVPQTALEEVLVAALERRGVQVRAPFQAATIEQSGGHVDVRVLRRELVTLGSPAHYSEWEPVDSSQVRAAFVIGADGYDSRTRSALGLESLALSSPETFAMFEFPTRVETGSLCRIVFDGELGSVMYPLPGNRVRWGFQIDRELDVPAEATRLQALLAEHAPAFVDDAERLEWGSVIHFERRLTRRFGKGRVWLAGDAAHVTSPFGNQSMNVGLLEAHDLVERMAESLTRGDAPRLDDYGAERAREWHKLLGVNVSYELLPHAPAWLGAHARRLVPALPVSGAALGDVLETLGVRLS